MMFSELHEAPLKKDSLSRAFDPISDMGGIKIRDMDNEDKPYLCTNYIESNYDEKEISIDSKLCVSKLALYLTEFILFTPILYFLSYVIFYFILIVSLGAGGAGECEKYDVWLYTEIAVFSANSIAVVLLIILAVCTPKDGICSYILNSLSILMRLLIIGSMVGMAIWAASIVSWADSGCSSGW